MPKDVSIPSFLIPQDGPSINITITGTDALVADQGYTYNQTSLTYNQLGVAYAGIYNTNEDIAGMILTAQLEEPMNIFINDLYTNNVPPPPNNQKIVGPGWFLYVAQV